MLLTVVATGITYGDDRWWGGHRRTLESRGARRTPDAVRTAPTVRGVIGRWDVEPDDLVQEAYAAGAAPPRKIEIEDLGPYLRRTIVNLATDERRRARKGAEVVQQLRPAPRGDDYPSELTDLLRLPERVHGALYLVDVEGMRSNDAADLVGMSPAVGGVALMRARRRLRVELSVESSGE